MIRPATENDLSVILSMCAKFYPFTSYWTRSKIPMDVTHVAVLIEALTENGLVHVAEVDGNVVGLIGLIVMPFMFNPNYITGGEIIWWVEPAHMDKGLGRALLRSIDQAAKDKNIHSLQMIDLADSPIQAGELYASEGYHLTERVWTKVV